MQEFFSNASGLMMLPSAAKAFANALNTRDPKAFDGFKRGPRTLKIDGTEITLNVRSANNSGHPGGTLIDGGAKFGGGYATVNGIAIIPIFGPMFKNHGDYGFADQVQIRANVRTATMDRSVSGILLFIDSPGGSVSGTKELADEVYAANAVKPVIAYIEDLGASAAYWTAAGARAIYINETGLAGSIGVVTSITDASKAYENAGIKIIPIVTGRYKNAGDPSQPSTPDTVGYFQGMINQFFDMFVAGVARGRGLSESTIRGLEAKIFIGADAKRLGLVNGVTSFDVVWDLIRRASDKNYKSHVLENNRYRARLQIEEFNN